MNQPNQTGTEPPWIDFEFHYPEHQGKSFDELQGQFVEEAALAVTTATLLQERIGAYLADEAQVPIEQREQQSRQIEREAFALQYLASRLGELSLFWAYHERKEKDQKANRPWNPDAAPEP